MRTLTQAEFCEALSGCLVYVVGPGAQFVFGYDRHAAVQVLSPYTSGGAMSLDLFRVPELVEYEAFLETCAEWLARERGWLEIGEQLDR